MSRHRAAPVLPADRLGQRVPTPAYVDPAAWARFVRNVLMLPDGGCHLWTSPPRASRGGGGYGQFWAPADAIQPPELDDEPLGLFPVDDHRDPGTADRVWRAHRFAWQAHHGLLRRRTEQLRHVCDQPLCTPITRDVLDAHLVPGANEDNVGDREQRGRGTRPGRHGLMSWGRADVRGPIGRSLAIHQALDAALDDGVTDRHELARLVAEVDAAGAPGPSPDQVHIDEEAAP